jgi:hypothetical protein
MNFVALTRLTPQDLRLFVEAYVRLSLCRWRLRRNADRIMRIARTKTGTAPVGRLIWSVNAAARRISGSSCLTKAVTLHEMLARHGHHSEVKIGVAKPGIALQAHAWLVWDGQVVMGGECAADYALLGNLAPKGSGLGR